MRASYQQRLDLLRGLMDTDGYYHESRKRFVMGTTQKWQAEDLLRLVSTLGIKATVFEVDKNVMERYLKDEMYVFNWWIKSLFSKKSRYRLPI